MMNIQTAAKDKCLDLLKEKGKAGARTLEILGKNYEFLRVFNTEVGYEILKDACAMHSDALNKISEFTATDEDKATFKAIQKIIFRWAKRLNDYEAQLGKVIK
jgi:hypothetical protein